MASTLIDLFAPFFRVKKKIQYETVFSAGIPQTAGEARYTNRQVVIVIDEKKSEMVKTMIHELLHVVSYHYLSPKQRLTESQVLKLEKGIYNLLKLNKIIE
jgi:hypothetical protein